PLSEASVASAPAATTTPSLPASTESPAPATSSSPPLAPTPATTPSGAVAGLSTLPPCPPDAADWFANAHTEITRVDLGCHYHALVAAWTRVEHASRFEHGPTNLPSKHRPEHVSAWISKNLRGKRGVEPRVTDPHVYAALWQQWWDSLQPSWRKKETDGRWSVEAYGEAGREWGPLYQWGVNGTLSILASLYFWGRAVSSGEQSELEVWEAAVLDVTWMMEGMATYYELFKRRF
ncbi:hypothetical protein B0H13DRAFT_1651900, partial [Mycena leptocephala]